MFVLYLLSCNEPLDLAGKSSVLGKMSIVLIVFAKTPGSGHLLFSLLADGTRVKRGDEGRRRIFLITSSLSSFLLSSSAHPSLIFSPSSLSLVSDCNKM